MSEFNQTLAEARRNQHIRRLWLSVGFVLIALVTTAALLVSKATPIEVFPEEISADADIDISQGLAMVISGHLYSLSKNVEIDVSAPGLNTSKKTISQPDFGKVTRITLQPLPGKLSLSTSLDDGQTHWYLNDGLISVADNIEKTLDAGDYTIEVKHPYYESQTHQYQVERGKQIEEQIQLTPITGELSLNSTPVGALVSIDGKDKGETPLTLTVSGGKHVIEISKTGFEAVSDLLEITDTKPQVDRQYRLALKRAEVSLSVSPDDGALSINGIDVPVANTIKVEANQDNVISYKKLGYISQSQRIHLSPTETANISFKLQKEMGNVAIDSTPKATVSVNGDVKGQTPLTLTLNAIPQEITFSLAGYRSVTRLITPSSKAMASVSATLLTEAQARLQEAPKSYKTRAGGEMVLFTPNDSITMGAERSEPGQRANEFIRTVSINQPFYAGLHEVTNGAYSQFAPGYAGDPQLPVTNVSWLDAVAYANWLSQAEGLSPVYLMNGKSLTKINAQADGYRLLTEAEWEWLARKAGRSTQSQFVWGNDKTLPRKAANIADESAKGSVKTYVPRYNDDYAGIAPVMSMNRELSGLFDMGGNVSEWTHDNYSLNVPNKDRRYSQTLDTDMSNEHVVKGANWRSGSLTELRASYRDGVTASRDDLGFRLGRFVYGGK